LRDGMGLTIGTEVAADFLYVLTGAHFLHVLGGVIALFALYANSWRRYRQPEDALMLNLDPGKIPGVELVATYWHFIGLLWIYLIIFFNVYT
jgi:cytochrome c oxidase subunit 3